MVVVVAVAVVVVGMNTCVSTRCIGSKQKQSSSPSSSRKVLGLGGDAVAGAGALQPRRAGQPPEVRLAARRG